MTAASPYEWAAVGTVVVALAFWIGHEFGHVRGYRAGVETSIGAFKARTDAPRPH